MLGVYATGRMPAKKVDQEVDLFETEMQKKSTNPNPIKILFEKKSESNNARRAFLSFFNTCLYKYKAFFFLEVIKCTVITHFNNGIQTLDAFPYCRKIRKSGAWYETYQKLGCPVLPELEIQQPAMLQ